MTTSVQLIMSMPDDPALGAHEGYNVGILVPPLDTDAAGPIVYDAVRTFVLQTLEIIDHLLPRSIVDQGIFNRLPIIIGKIESDLYVGPVRVSDNL
jgi:hypothetical protein